MLVLTRRIGEAIILSDVHGNVLATMTTLGINGGQVRYGIHAVESIHIDREEIFEKKIDEVVDANTEALDRGPPTHDRRFRRKG